MADLDKNKSFAWELFLLSAAALYIELLVISWMSSDIRAFTVFKTFPLVTCFVGLGLGFSLGTDKAFRLALLAVLQFIATMKLIEHFQVNFWFFPSVSVFSWQHNAALGQHFWTYVFCFVTILILVLMGPFSLMACLGSRLGTLFSKLDSLKAYCINIGGSIAGSLLFGFGSYLEVSPSILLIPAVLLIAIYVYRTNERKWMTILPVVLVIGLASWGQIRSGIYGAYWSPYQKLEMMPFDEPANKEHADVKHVGTVIGSNHLFYQYTLDLSQSNLERKDLSAHAIKFLRENATNYNLPYKLKAAKDVLILGAGSGNDVAAALRNGVEKIDAVDIDPVIIRLGKKYHPEHPYDSEKVHVVCNDARNFLLNCQKKYDLIIFAGLDSHIVTGQGSSVRIDNYVYTKESIGHALSLLKPDGMMVLSFCKAKPWLTERLFFTIAEAGGYNPICLTDASHPDKQWEIYLSGPAVRDHLVKISDDIFPIAIEQNPTKGEVKQRVLTDDWPFVYVLPIAIDGPYLLVVFTVLLLSIFAVRRSLFKANSPALWQMFFLGAAFLLLELQSIARLSLIYGSTWQTSSIVINGVLILILLANFVVIKFRAQATKSINLFYLLLFASLLGSYFLANHVLLNFPVFGTALVTLVTLLPIFAAGLIFATAFAQQPSAGEALAFNLFGAVVGAMLEYLSNYWGISFLVVIAMLLYLSSFICAKRASSSINI